MGSYAFPCTSTWLVQCCTGKMLLTNLKETGVLEHVFFVASLLRLSVHMGAYLLRTHLAAFFCHSFSFFLPLQSTFLLGYSWSI